jgi:hypothetical protein
MNIGSQLLAGPDQGTFVSQFLYGSEHHTPFVIETPEPATAGGCAIAGLCLLARRRPRTTAPLV